MEKPQEAAEQSQALKAFAEICRDRLSKEQKALFQRLSLLAEVDREKANLYFRDHAAEIKSIVLPEILANRVPFEIARPLLSALSENTIMRELYEQYGKKYQLGARGQETTDCVQILRHSPAFRDLSQQNSIRFFSEGSDLVLDEKLGSVVDVVDRGDFEKLRQYRPTDSKIYIFGLVKPPFYTGGKPNITHLQIATNLNEKDNQLAIIHASADKGSVVVEPDIGVYLATHTFERVYVIEINLQNPFSPTQFSREPKHHGRPHIYDLPVTRDRFQLIDPKKEVPIYPEERATLELISDNRALSYLTLITGFREGKLGKAQNITETIAFRTLVNPESHSLGLHQITSVVAPLFDRWIEGIDEKKAQEIGNEIHALWLKKQSGKAIEWVDLIPHLNSYNIRQQRYANVTVSTICSYLLIKHLFEDQLMSAYEAYGETFFGLEEQPEAIVALGSAYRFNMDVIVRGSQQYRIAEMAHRLELIDEKFEFTERAHGMPEFAAYLEALGDKDLYKNQFLVDGYRGVQLQHLAYLCYKTLYSDGRIPFKDFETAYAGSRTNLLASAREPVRTMRQEYEKLFGVPPKLLITEDELRGRKIMTGLRAKTIKFANEGLWVATHFRKLRDENWMAINRRTSGDGTANSIVESVLEERSLRTNEISKILPQQGKRFRSLISNLSGNPWYKKYPDLLMAACFVKGLFLEELRGRSDGIWIQHTQDFLRTLFEVNLPLIEAALPRQDERSRVILAVASSILSVEEIIGRIHEGTKPEDLLRTIGANPEAIRLQVYSKSFDRLRDRFAIKDPVILARKEKLNEKEQREAFALDVFRTVRFEAESRGLSLNFALVATAMACLECGWGREKTEWGDPTLYAAAYNIFSVKHDLRQYTEEDFLSQDPKAPFYIHHTREYFNPENPEEFTEHYEAFRRYQSPEEAVSDFFDLIERRYPLTSELAQTFQSPEPNREHMERVAEALISEKYATDPEYAAKTLDVTKSVTKILRDYGQII